MKPGPGNRGGMSVEAMLKDPNIILDQIKVSKEKFLVRSWEKSADTLVITKWDSPMSFGPRSMEERMRKPLTLANAVALAERYGVELLESVASLLA